jgi:ketosteroid isomerase-like protein
MSTMTENTLALAKRFFDAIEKGDIDTVRAIYAPDAVIWHNNDGLETTREDNLKVLTNFIKAVPERRYLERRVGAFDGGFVQQHLLKGKLANGKDLALACCIVCEVKDGRITRLDEYFDPAALAVFRA